MFDEVDHHQHFLAGSTIIPLCLGKSMDAISNNLFLPILLLGEYSTYSAVSTSCVKEEGVFKKREFPLQG